MKRKILIDPYFEKQPPLAFLEELKQPIHTGKPAYFNKNEINGLYLRSFPNEPLLETIYKDFNLFLKVYEIAGNNYPIDIVYAETECFEAYELNIESDKITIKAGDTEGIRRALIWLEDEIRCREGAFLYTGTVKRKPFVRARITRCFFSPINRPPKYGDELSDEIDYYPEEYLNRLMHDGANGVWIYTRFSDILPSSIIAEHGVGYKKRIEKLNKVIEKCANYGIKVYVFAIEPVAFNAEMAQKYPEIAGTSVGYGKTFCTFTEKGRAFCEESTAKMFELCPDLGGYISITFGERATNCASTYPTNTCPNCGGKHAGEVLANAVEALKSGMRKVKPGADFISWTYGHRLWNFDDIREYVDLAPDDVMLMQNFDDMCYEEQLGVMRQGVDYWLSYAGASELFEITAEQAQKSGKHMFAKMQLCCSHEIATVPYIPVPGILYNKYKIARKWNVEGIMQCWYFGNYPSLMSKAAGELSFIGEFDDEQVFLKRLAGIYWGESRAETIVKAWKCFEASYRQYPLNVMFSYYGPMADGPVWELQLMPKNFSLPRTWQTLDPPDGDRIGEALLNGHSLYEAWQLVEKMCDDWRKGLEILNIQPQSPDETEQLSLINALNIMLHSGRNILKFYQLRDNLGCGNGDSISILSEMRAIARMEIENSRKLSALCEADGRLGYHSEGEGYKYFPEKLHHRIEQLETLLETEFVEVEKRIEDGLSLLEYYDGIESDAGKSYNMSSGEWEPIGNNSKFKAAYSNNKLTFEFFSESIVNFTLCPEYRLLYPDATVVIDRNGKVELGYNSFMYYSLFGERAEKELARYTVIALPCDGTHLIVEVSGVQIRPMKMKILAGSESWCVGDNKIITLGKSDVSPEDYGWLLP
ncbi:MAG: hypothetical protein FWF15_02460 [Oscillospiraceae bacterium]|nr:hypothetical protein [Oscillospiraceae bacterium]